MRCAGPYTRVFLDKKDASACRKLLDTLGPLGLEVTEALVPEGNGRTEDFVFSAKARGLGGEWTLGLGKFLGPKKLLRQTHIYEITLDRSAAGENAEDDEPWRGHLFDTGLSPLFARLATDWPHLAAGKPLEEWVPRDEAHEHRIDLCVG